MSRGYMGRASARGPTRPAIIWDQEGCQASRRVVSKEFAQCPWQAPIDYPRHEKSTATSGQAVPNDSAADPPDGMAECVPRLIGSALSPKPMIAYGLGRRKVFVDH